ncbi:MAG: ATP-binding protein [Victivallaceae bacterium]|nr:ATP-binding protein [Victivallaceae bacterium]
MKELVIISGKGGTGKTSLTASFAALAGKAALADCDVDAADLHLLLSPRIMERHEFFSGNEAVIDPARCKENGSCIEACRFEAIGFSGGRVVVDPYACEGCGACLRVCESHAIDFPERKCGEWYESETKYGPMIHARLAPAGENSGKLVTQVRQAAKAAAERLQRDIVLVDGPPGIGCPVIASLSGASAVLVVAEPTVSGEHDMERVLQLAGHFGVPAMICVNKWDLNPEAASRIELKAEKSGAVPVGRIPYDHTFTEAMINGKLVIHYSESEASKSILQVWRNVCRAL